MKGRGTELKLANRFKPILIEKSEDWSIEEPLPKTQFFKDSSRTILSQNDSPDIPFRYSLNPYRGCEHGCIYCYARPTHEYFELSSGLDFETKIFVKEDAPALLRQTFSSASWVPQTVALSGVTDPYQPVERKLQLTRKCLQVFAEFLNPVSIITKNFLVTREIDILGELAAARAAAVFISLTTLEDSLRRAMEPRTASPSQRLRAIELLSKARIPVGVLVAPVIPGLNDHEIPKILSAARDAGALYAGYVPLRLPYGLKELFSDWLSKNFPDSKSKVLNQICALRGGKLNDSEFGSRMRGKGIYAKQLESLFEIFCRKTGLSRDGPELSSASFRRVSVSVQKQLDFFSNSEFF